MAHDQPALDEVDVPLLLPRLDAAAVADTDEVESACKTPAAGVEQLPRLPAQLGEAATQAVERPPPSVTPAIDRLEVDGRPARIVDIELEVRRLRK